MNNKKKRLQDSQVSKETIVLGKTCPEVANPRLLAEDSQSISKFLQAVCDGKENDKSYPWFNIVNESVTNLLEELSYNLWKTFTDKSTKRKYTQELVLAQRTMYINQVATFLIANFCGEFTGEGSLGSGKNKASSCVHCSKPMLKAKRCARCKKVNYCSKECQLNHWPSHRGVCKKA